MCVFQFLQSGIQIFGLPLAHKKNKVSRSSAAVSWKLTTLASHNCWAKFTSWVAADKVAHSSLPPSSHQLERWSGCRFPEECNGCTMPHGDMCHPLYWAANAFFDHPVAEHGQVQTVENKISVATAFAMGTPHHRARDPHPIEQQTPVRRAVRAAALWLTHPPRLPP